MACHSNILTDGDKNWKYKKIRLNQKMLILKSTKPMILVWDWIIEICQDGDSLRRKFYRCEDYN